MISSYVNNCGAIGTALEYIQAYLFTPNSSKLFNLLNNTVQVQITTKESKTLENSRTITKGQIRIFNEKILFEEWLTQHHFNRIEKIQIQALKIIGKANQAKIEILSKFTQRFDGEQIEIIHLITDEEKKIIEIVKERILINKCEIRDVFNFHKDFEIQHCFDFLKHYLLHPDQKKILRVSKKHSSIKNLDITTWVNAHLPRLRETSFIRLKIDLINGEEKICSIQKVEYKPGEIIDIRVIDTLKLSPLTMRFKTHSFKCADV